VAPAMPCKKPSCSDKIVAGLLMVEVIYLLSKAGGSHARKGFDVANQMRLVGEVEGSCHVGQSCKASGFDEAYRCSDTLNPVNGMSFWAHAWLVGLPPRRP
jgi:hypothetical protein